MWAVIVILKFIVCMFVTYTVLLKLLPCTIQMFVFMVYMMLCRGKAVAKQSEVQRYGKTYITFVYNAGSKCYQSTFLPNYKYRAHPYVCTVRYRKNCPLDVITPIHRRVMLDTLLSTLVCVVASIALVLMFFIL